MIRVTMASGCLRGPAPLCSTLLDILFTNATIPPMRLPVCRPCAPLLSCPSDQRMRARFCFPRPGGETVTLPDGQSIPALRGAPVVEDALGHRSPRDRRHGPRWDWQQITSHVCDRGTLWGTLWGSPSAAMRPGCACGAVTSLRTRRAVAGWALDDQATRRDPPTVAARHQESPNLIVPVLTTRRTDALPDRRSPAQRPVRSVYRQCPTW